MDSIAENFNRVRDRLAASALLAGRRPGEIRLVAVSKTHPLDAVRQAALAGAGILGESYVQEAKAKMAQAAASGLPQGVEWHFIGRLQTNKAKDVAGAFALIHSVDRLSLAEELNRRAMAKGCRQPVLCQVNISGETTKGGAAPAEALDLVTRLAAMPHLELRGLMTMPPLGDDPEASRPFFRSLRLIAEAARQRTGLALPELSMGMSHDFEVAVAEGATLVRVGTAIFGERA